MFMENLHTQYKKWKFKNTFLLLITLIIVFYLYNSPYGQEVIEKVPKLGYVGSIVLGIFFVSTFTVAPAGILLFELSQTYNPFLVALFAGSGAVIGDYVIFRFFKDSLFDELRPIFSKLSQGHLSHLYCTPYFAWLTPVIGALIIASPFPDEIGIGLLGFSKLKNWQFMILSFFLNSIGILAMITIAKSI